LWCNGMSENFKEAMRWLRQAEKDLSTAKNSFVSGDYEWACFQSQQSAEKALKSVLYSKGFRKILTHSIFELVKETSDLEGGFKKFKKEAKVLDSVYIPARYPNGIAGDLAPFEYYEKEDAEECIKYAELILEEVKKLIKK
jgi:HEPN domain-containing protein